MSEIDSKKKFDIVFRELHGKDWITIRFSKGGTEWVPSFVDVARVVRALAHCEDKKYPPPQYQGGLMVLEFLQDCFTKSVTLDEIASRYDIPDRNGKTFPGIDF